MNETHIRSNEYAEVNMPAQIKWVRKKAKSENTQLKLTDIPEYSCYFLIPVKIFLFAKLNFQSGIKTSSGQKIFVLKECLNKTKEIPMEKK